MSLSASIIIPSYCRPRQLTSCLDSLTRLDYSKDDFEVIVVDDGSPMRLDAVVERFQSSLRIRLIRQENQGPAVARNTGVNAAQGKVLAFIDDDCLADAPWLTALVRTLKDDPTVLVGGRIINSLSENQFSEASQALTEYLYEYYTNHNHERRFFTSNNMACLAEIFREMGGFCQQYFAYVSEDRDLSNRWSKAGYKLQYAPDALVLHAHDLALGTFLKQHFFYGQGAFAFHKVRAHGGTPRLEPISFYKNLILSPFGASKQHPLALSYLLALAQAANASGFFWALGRNLLHPRSYQRKEFAPLKSTKELHPLEFSGTGSKR